MATRLLESPFPPEIIMRPQPPTGLHALLASWKKRHGARSSRPRPKQGPRLAVELLENRALLAALPLADAAAAPALVAPLPSSSVAGGALADDALAGSPG